MDIFPWYMNKDFHVDPYGENGILFLAELVVLMDIKYNSLPISKPDLEHAISVAIRDNRPFSHDNATAVYALQDFYGIKKDFFLADWWRRLHPRDVFFNLAVCYKPLWYLFLPINSLFILLTVFRDHWKNIDGDQVLATDGKLLAFVKLNTYNIPFTKKLCDDRIIKRFGGWHKLFELYFRYNQEHPCIRLSKELYG
jgi:hypothetical protein